MELALGKDDPSLLTDLGRSIVCIPIYRISRCVVPLSVSNHAPLLLLEELPLEVELVRKETWLSLYP